MRSFEASPAARARFVADRTPAGAEAFRPAGLAGDAAAAESREPDAAERVREAYEKGLAAGRAELPWREAEAVRSAASALEEAARGLAALRRSYLVEQRRALVDLALAVAEHVLGRVVAADLDALASVVECVLAELPEAAPVELRFSTRDHETLAAGLAPALSALAEEHGIAVTADARLAPGDVRARARDTEVDARLRTLLRRLREELLEAAESLEGNA